MLFLPKDEALKEIEEEFSQIGLHLQRDYDIRREALQYEHENRVLSLMDWYDWSAIELQEWVRQQKTELENE